MKEYILFFVNWETKHEGNIRLEFIPSCPVEEVIGYFFSFWDSVNPRTTFTLVEI